MPGHVSGGGAECSPIDDHLRTMRQLRHTDNPYFRLERCEITVCDFCIKAPTRVLGGTHQIRSARTAQRWTDDRSSTTTWPNARRMSSQRTRAGINLPASWVGGSPPRLGSGTTWSRGGIGEKHRGDSDGCGGRGEPADRRVREELVGAPHLDYHR